ncbi:hypothetical protein C1645_834794 [Glomus cerebriforme]|uniref:BACK domain-containing protein n=1 Tax=Glomus cerebriforme TaxID=658196 RepID=A0A397S8Z5_9GLOM|nr:hypothetical protein C1645_834794 [Glomus cerebriforme]
MSYFRFIYCGNIELKNLQEFLIEHQAEFLFQNPTGILETVYQHEIFTDLWNFCLEKVCKEPNILFSSDEFINLKSPLLELLLKRDDLNIDEIEIWEGLLKWCFAQQNMSNDPTKWSKEDITKIEKELYRFIPLIQFYDIKPADFFYKVYCYKDILPQDLIHDLLNIILNCDNKGATIWVAKIKDSTQLIGGYNPFDWDGDAWKITTESLLFNITDGVDTAKLGYVNHTNFAVYCKDDYDIGILTNFEVEDYEVF